ncbi:hypothetical protein [Treponema sp. R80B11-R83G3]
MEFNSKLWWNKKNIASINDFTVRVNEYIPGFNKEMSSICISSLLDAYMTLDTFLINSDENDTDISEYENSLNDHIDYIKNNINNPEFKELFKQAILLNFKDENLDIDIFIKLSELLLKCDIEINNTFNDKILNELYNLHLNRLTNLLISEKSEILIKAIMSDKFEAIVNETVKTIPIIKLDIFIIQLIKLCKEYFNEHNDIIINNIIIDNIIKTNQLYKLNIDLEQLDDFQALKYFSFPVDDRINLFEKFINNIIKKNGKKILGKKTYWGKIPLDIETRLRSILKISENDRILIASDYTALSSWQEFFLITIKGIYIIKNKNVYLNWEKIINEYELNFYFADDHCLYIQNIGYKQNKKELNSIESPYIENQVLANIFYGACLYLTGQKMKVATDSFKPIDGAIFDIPKLKNYEDTPENNENTVLPENKTEELPDEKIIEEVKKPESKEDRYKYLRTDDRINIAKKYKDRKGFFRHILPSSWLLTLFFYLLISLVIMLLAESYIPKTNDIINTIVPIFTVLIIPLTLLIFGINKRIKYIKEKKKWKECTDSGKKDINDVYKEYKELENEFNVQ